MRYVLLYWFYRDFAKNWEDFYEIVCSGFRVVQSGALRRSEESL
jgi:hypothetical protein